MHASIFQPDALCSASTATSRHPPRPRLRTEKERCETVAVERGEVQTPFLVRLDFSQVFNFSLDVAARRGRLPGNACPHR